jgi:AhpD family alkylhydroperoxidase
VDYFSPRLRKKHSFHFEGKRIMAKESSALGKNKGKITAKNGKTMIRVIREQLGDDKLTAALVESLTEQNGSLGFILNILKERPRNFNPFILKGMAIYKEPQSLDRKTAELVAIGAAAALRCEHCLEAHMHRARTEGASLDQIMDAILIAGAIADSSTLSIAFRKYKQLEGKSKKADKNAGNNE